MSSMLLYQALAVMGNLGSLDSTSEDDSLSGDSLSDSGKGSKDKNNNAEGTTENTEKQGTKTKAQTDTQTTEKDTKATTATEKTNTKTNTNTNTATTDTQTNTATKKTKETGTTKTDDSKTTTGAKGSAKYNQWGFTGDQSVWKAPTTLASGLSGSASKSTHSVHGNKTSNANILRASDNHQYSWKSKFLVGSLIGSALVLNAL